MRYQLRCVDCTYALEMEADVFDVLDRVEAHKETHDGEAAVHFVEFEAVES